MQISSDKFVDSSIKALSDPQLRTAFSRASKGFVDKRSQAIARINNFAELKEQAANIKDRTLAHLGYYLEQFEENAKKNGTQIHWAKDGPELNSIVIRLAGERKVRHIVKGKSMVSEETLLNEALEQEGFTTTETDLGEYILQLAQEKPSHIIAPAIHKTREQIAQLFHQHHKETEQTQQETPAELVSAARKILRKYYLEADMGITGANFLVAETGAMILVTNEGNGDLCSILPPYHLVTVGIEKIVPTMEDAFTLLRLLTNSATGQAITSYVTIIQGAAHPTDADGPQELHLILLDNGRSKIRKSQYRDILRCIRCGACLNHCPVYTAIGGHSYGSVYPGPLGAVLTPLLADAKQASHLPNASSFCGRCEEVCPVKIPLTHLMRQLRAEQQQHRKNWLIWLAMKIMLFPPLYRLILQASIIWLRLSLPVGRAWTKERDIPKRTAAK